MKKVVEVNLENKVVQSNFLVKTVSKSDLMEMKIFEIIVSCIDTQNVPKNNTLFISKKSIFKALNLERHKAKYTYLKSILHRFGRGRVFENGTHVLIAPIARIEYEIIEKSDTVSFEIDRALMPHLVELKKNFTQYQLKNVVHLSSRYAIILYKWLIMWHNQDVNHPIIDTRELRQLTGTTDIYKAFGDFEKRVLKLAQEEIIEKTDLTISYEKIKEGRRISKIKFFIQRKDELTAQEHAHNLYRNDKDKAEEERLQAKTNEQNTMDINEFKELKFYFDALKDRYIKYLIDNQFISFDDEKIVVKVYQTVTPFYEEMSAYDVEKNRRDDLTSFKKHIKRIQDYQSPTSPYSGNMAKYLYIAAKDYVGKLLLKS